MTAVKVSSRTIIHIQVISIIQARNWASTSEQGGGRMRGAIHHRTTAFSILFRHMPVGALMRSVIVQRQALPRENPPARTDGQERIRKAQR